MTIGEAVARYLADRQRTGFRPSMLDALRRMLHTVFAPVLSAHIAVLTPEQVRELRARLGRPGVQNKRLSMSARERLWRTSRAFLLWCVQQQLHTRDPLVPRPVLHLGELARRLRQEAGILRRDLAAQTDLLDTTLGHFETGRVLLSREQLLRLLQHPCMVLLPDKAKEAGVALGLGNNGVGKHYPSPAARGGRTKSPSALWAIREPT